MSNVFNPPYIMMHVVVKIYEVNYPGNKIREVKSSETMKDKRVVKLECFSKLPFWTYNYLKKLKTFTFWCMVIPLVVHIRFTPNEGPKRFVS